MTTEAYLAGLNSRLEEIERNSELSNNQDFYEFYVFAFSQQGLGFLKLANFKILREVLKLKLKIIISDGYLEYYTFLRTIEKCRGCNNVSCLLCVRPDKNNRAFMRIYSHWINELNDTLNRIVNGVGGLG